MSMNRARISIVTAVVGLAGLSPLASSQQPRAASRATLIVGATLIDGNGGTPRPNAAILIEGDKITAVGAAADVKAPAGAQIIRADGKYVLPGLWESHFHYRSWHGELMLHYGITTAVDLGSQTEWILAARDAVAKGKVRAPRLMAAGWILSGTPPAGAGGRRARGGGSNVDLRSESAQVYHTKENFPNHATVRGGPEAMRAFVRQEIDAGVDTIKVFPDMSREELKAVTSEAHKAGLPVIGHVEDAYAAIEDGLDGITHTFGIARTLMPPDKLAELAEGKLNTSYTWIDRTKMDALVARMVEKGTFLGPCLIHDHAPEIKLAGEFEAEDRQILSDPNLNYIYDDARVAMRDYLHVYRSDSAKWGEFPPKEMLPREAVDEFSRGYENAKEFVRRFAKAGGHLFTGTDLGGSAFIPGLIVHREMRVWVEEVGLTPMQAIVASTRDAAALMHKEKTMGTIEVGKIADLIVVSANPLADIRNTQKIETVMLAGQIVDRSLHRDYSSPIREVGSEGAYNTGHAVPGIIGLAPRVVIEGAPATRVVVEGSGLHLTSKAYVDGSLVPSRLIDGTHLELTVPSEMLLVGGTRAVTLVNSAPGGGMSKAYALIVRFK
jgi:imidazolonepropionase-like amidohydrolase